MGVLTDLLFSDPEEFGRLFIDAFDSLTTDIAVSVSNYGSSMFETVSKITGFFEFTTRLVFFFVKNPMMLVFIGFTMALVMSITADNPIDWMGKMAHNTKEIILFFVLVLSEIGSMLLGALKFIRELSPV